MLKRSLIILALVGAAFLSMNCCFVPVCAYETDPGALETQAIETQDEAPTWTDDASSSLKLQKPK